MIKLSDDRRKVPGAAIGGVWVGDSLDENAADLATSEIGAVLNVAHDMVSTRLWMHGIEAAHIGLIDGPGNDPAGYCAAVLQLHNMLRRHNVLVCCHSGGRALAVGMMYLNMVAPSRREWEVWLERLAERADGPLPMVHEAHVAAFSKINWSAVRAAIER